MNSFVEGVGFSVARPTIGWTRWNMSELMILATRRFFDLLNLATLGNLSPLVAVAAVIERDGQILMIQRNDGLGLGLPGGIIKWKETTEEALRREVLEETGYEVAITGLIGVYSGPNRDPRFSCVEIAYSASIVDGHARPSPEGRLAWVSKASLPDNLAFDHEEAVVDYLEGKGRAPPRRVMGGSIWTD